jgi:hypothetical protein
MKSVMFALVGTLAFTSLAVAAPPAAPTITVAASNIKQLQFDITPVSAINRYELWFKASPGTPWVLYAQTPPQRPRFRINVSVHLLDWQQARFHVKACNSATCSQSNEVGVNGEQFAAMGYFKPSTSQPSQYFGMQFALSADGMTMAVISQARINHAPAARIHVYRRTSSSSGWHLDARLYTNPNLPFSGLSWGDAISLSGDGKTLVTANWAENDGAGAVYLFRRGDSGWRQTQRLVGQLAGDQFGVNVKLDSAGKTLIIARVQDGGEHREGTLDVYQDLDDGSDAFVYATTVPTPVFDDPQWGWCRHPALSDAGHIVRACFTGAEDQLFTQVLTAISSAPLQYVETARLPGEGEHVVIDSKGERLLAIELDSGRSWVSVYRREGSSWTNEAQLSPFKNPNGDFAFGGLPRISGDGKIIAIAHSEDTLLGRGPLFPPYAYSPSSSDGNGTVAIYDLRPTGWRLRRYVKPDTDNRFRGFAWDVALNDNGHVMAVGSPYDDSTTTGINGERNDGPVNGNSGAIWLY